ncbi:MAG TPA: radical SAM protein [Bellilinea sp.]|nr:radical SAM protein [Bellilinea sp.]
MSKIDDFLTRFFPPHQPIEPGIYSDQSPADADQPYRYHLRVEPDGTGVFIINAKTVLFLNQSATEYAYHKVMKTNPNDIAAIVAKRFKTDPAQALLDYRDFELNLEAMLKTPDLDPTIYLDADRTEPHTRRLSPPLRINYTLTYSVRQDEPPDSAPIGDSNQELTTMSWFKIIDDAWTFGIPHVIFTGGEATLRLDLPQIIEHAQTLGMVTGLLTDGLKFNEADYLASILNSGLDHVMVILNIDDPASWTALDAVLAEDIFVTPHLTVTRDNSDRIFDGFDRLVRLKVPSISLSITDKSLALIQEDLRDRAAHAGIELEWDIPVPYSALNPVAIEQQHDPEETSGAGRSWLYVEPDGDVYPGQGMVTELGNLTQVNWETVWENAQNYSKQVS